MSVTVDPDHKFELALQLGRLEVAHTIAKTAESDQKWKQLADLALSTFKVTTHEPDPSYFSPVPFAFGESLDDLIPIYKADQQIRTTLWRMPPLCFNLTLLIFFSGT